MSTILNAAILIGVMLSTGAYAGTSIETPLSNEVFVDAQAEHSLETMTHDQRWTCYSEDRWGAIYDAHGKDRYRVQERAHRQCERATGRSCHDLGCSRF